MGAVVTPKQVRAAETRERLLKAAVECLYLRGYSGTTAKEVCKLAGVSRGAHAYHFETKGQLMTATVEYLVEQRNLEFREAIERLPQEDRYEAGIDLIWEILSGETFFSWLEVLVAARTDPELLESVTELNARVTETIEANFRELFPELAGTEPFALLPQFLFCLLEGMALGSVANPHPERIMQVFRTLKKASSVLLQLGPMIEMSCREDAAADAAFCDAARGAVLCDPPDGTEARGPEGQES